MKLSGGLDTGNGFMKGEIKGNEMIFVDYPSTHAVFSLANDIKAEGPAVANVIADIFNQMDISISSDLVPDGKRRIFGKRAIKSGERTVSFDVNDLHRSKAEQEMSPIMVIGTFAGVALKSWYDAEKKLPDKMITACVTCALALPIDEYRKYKDIYAESLKKGSHLVTFYNFVEPVRVEVKFEEVLVFAEGAAARFAIKKGGADIEKALTEKLKGLGTTANMVQKAKNMLLIDIGDGTVNMAVFQGGELSPDASGTIDQGYGTMLDKCLRRLKPMGYPFGSSRKKLADFLLEEPTPFTRERYNVVSGIVEDEENMFCDDIVLSAENYITSMGGSTEFMLVIGGGSIPLRRVLEAKLNESGKRLSGIPVIYMQSEDARKLNARGLRMIAETLFGKGKAQDAKK